MCRPALPWWSAPAPLLSEPSNTDCGCHALSPASSAGCGRWIHSYTAHCPLQIGGWRRLATHQSRVLWTLLWAFITRCDNMIYIQTPDCVLRPMPGFCIFVEESIILSYDIFAFAVFHSFWYPHQTPFWSSNLIFCCSIFILFCSISIFCCFNSILSCQESTLI